MLYYLFRFLEQFGISGSHMWGYISFRSLLALILSLVISAWFGEKFIKYTKKKQITETQRDASIDPFGVKKIGVPSMGGVIIIVSILIPVLLLGRLRNIYLILMIITTVWLGFLGGMDDFIKIFRRNKEGLKGRYKIVGQVGIGLIVGLVLWASPDVKMNENLSIERQGHGGGQAPCRGPKVAQDDHPLCQGPQPGLLSYHVFLRQVQDGSRLGAVRGDDHTGGYRRK